MRKEIVTCDECGTERKEANHWFLVHEDGQAIVVDRWRQPSLDVHQHICGETCLHKRIAKWASQ